MPKTWLTTLFSRIMPGMERIWGPRLHICLVTGIRVFIWMWGAQSPSPFVMCSVGRLFFLLLTSLCYVGSVTTYLSIIFNFTIYSSWEEVPEKKISFWAPPFQRKVQMRFIRSIILFSSFKKKNHHHSSLRLLCHLESENVSVCFI